MNMKKILKTGMGLMISSLLLIGCHTPKIEDDPSEKAKAISVATKFLGALFEGDFERTKSYAAVPFWGDGEVFLSQEIFERELKKQVNNSSSKTEFKIINARLFSTDDLSLINPKLIKKFEKNNFDSQYIYIVALRISLGENEEFGLILMQKKQGKWRVVGLDD